MKPRIDDIETAIIAAIQADATLGAYIPDNQVQTLGQRGVDFESEQIVIVPPAILTVYLGGPYGPTEVTKTRYSIEEHFLLVAVAENLRGAAEAKRGGVSVEKGCYDILEDLKTLFAGKRITVATSTNITCTLVKTTFEGVTRSRAFAFGLEIVAGDARWDNA